MLQINSVCRRICRHCFSNIVRILLQLLKAKRHRVFIKYCVFSSNTRFFWTLSDLCWWLICHLADECTNTNHVKGCIQASTHTGGTRVQNMFKNVEKTLCNPIEKQLIRWSTQIKKFYCVFTRFEGFCIEWKQKQKVVVFWPKVVVGHQTAPTTQNYPPRSACF